MTQGKEINVNSEDVDGLHLTKLNVSAGTLERLIGIYAIRATLFLNKMLEEKQAKEKALRERDVIAMRLNGHQLYEGRLESMIEEFLDEGNTVYNEGLTPKQMELLSIIRKKISDKRMVINKLKPTGPLFQDEVSLAG